MTAALVAATGLGYLALRTTLDRQIDTSLLNVASIQAATVAEGPGGEMHFHEWNLTPEEAAALKDLVRYMQIWSEGGESLLRSSGLAMDLPLDTLKLSQAANGELVWAEHQFQGETIRCVYYPLGRLGSGHERHVLQVAASLTWRNQALRNSRLFLVALVLLVSGSTFLGSWWLALTAVRPVHEIMDQAEEIGVGRLGKKISTHADTREYDRLVRVLNTMLRRIDAAFEAQRRFTADASHELRSPLTALHGELELALRRDRTPEEYSQVIHSALEETERLTELAQDLLTLARADAGVMEPRIEYVHLDELVTATLGRLEGKAAAKGVRLSKTKGGPLAVLCDPDLIDRLVWNLVDNAIKFTTAGGAVEVDLLSSAEHTAIEVRDTGPGIRENAMEKIFERFYREDAPHTASEGTGLGLSIVRAIAQAHGGDVTVRNRAQGGAAFRIHLPIRGPEVPAGPQPSPPGPDAEA
jgi:two-component system OmpR family sensor kinase